MKAVFNSSASSVLKKKMYPYSEVSPLEEVKVGKSRVKKSLG
jgi:hypothetical protein